MICRSPGSELAAVTHIGNRHEVLVEKTINSSRVSFKFKKNDELDKLLYEKLFRFMMQRAEKFSVLRRIPIKVDYKMVIWLNSEGFRREFSSL